MESLYAAMLKLMRWLGERAPKTFLTVCNVIYRITDCRTLRNSPLENHWTLELEKRAGPSSFWNAIATFRLFRIEFRKGAEVVLIEARKSLSAYGQLVRPIDFGAARGE